MSLNQHKSDVYQSYQAWSNIYDAQENPTRDCSTAVLKTILPELTNLFVVEAGCGTGWNSVWLSPKCHRLIGLDFSENMLALAKEKVNQPNVELKVHNLLLPWPVEHAWADLILINLVIEHIENLAILLYNAAQVMKLGSQLVITEYHPERVKRGAGAEFNQDDEGITEIINYWHPLEHYEEAGLQAGLHIKEVKTWHKELDKDQQPVETAVNPLLPSVTMVKI
ncbi:MAG: class I SAM-dependent methyltransferase [Chloroflexota bacterium]